MNSDGRCEVLGLDVVTAEDGVGWLAFLRSLRARGLKGVELVISDAHPGLKDAIASVLRGAVLAAAARRHHAMPAQIGLAWLLARSPVMLPIRGARRPERLEEN